ncbi:MAG: hypothetical protein ACR2OB_08600 [Solirubrobacteraceae bacterium]
MRRIVLAALAVFALVCAGCGGRGSGPGAGNQAAASPGAGSSDGRAHPQAIDPVPGAAVAPASPSTDPAQVSVGSPSGGALAQPVSDAEIRKELVASGLSANANQAMLTPDGLAVAPADAPAVVQQVIDAGNEIAHLPYRFGGGHGTFEDTAYDCSGSISFVFAAARLLSTTLTSGDLMRWGAPGRGKWITVFANQGHTFMYIAGLRFDTVAYADSGSRWSNRSATEGDSFAIRHPQGL